MKDMHGPRRNARVGSSGGAQWIPRKGVAEESGGHALIFCSLPHT